MRILEREQKAFEFLCAEALQLPVHDVCHIGSCDSEKPCRAGPRELPVPQQVANCEGRVRLCQAILGIGEAEVLEDIAAADLDSLIVSHRRSSRYSYRSAQSRRAAFQRDNTRSLSDCGVAMPDLDFFLRE
jgi:hypothetical protein